MNQDNRVSISTSKGIARILFFVMICIVLCWGCKPSESTRKPELVGADRDKHGCIGSAGYTWSDVRQECIRLFEKGIRLEATSGKESSFIVFSPDSAKVELFFSDNNRRKILNRHILPNGTRIWRVKDSDKQDEVINKAGVWLINLHNEVTYRQNK